MWQAEATESDRGTPKEPETDDSLDSETGLDHSARNAVRSASADVPGKATDGAAPHDQGGRSSLHHALTLQKWRQGSLLPPNLHSDVRMQPFGPWDTPPEGSFCIVVSQDCDLVHDTIDDEPAAEVVIGEVISRKNQANTNARHPRELHVEIETPENDTRSLKILATARGWIHREKLERAKPLQGWVIKPAHLDWVVSFLGNRYERTAYPDEFEKRAASLRRELKGIKKQFPTIRQYLIQVEPMDDERRRGQPYLVRLVAVLDDEAMNSSGDKLAKLQADIRRKVGQAVDRTADIELEDIKVDVLRYLYVGDVDGKAEFDV